MQKAINWMGVPLPAVTSKCVHWSNVPPVKVWWRYVFGNTNVVHYCDIFSNIGQCFRLAELKILENQKSSHVRIILDKASTKTSIDCCRYAADTLQIDDRQNTIITDRETFLIFVWLMLIYGPFGSKALLVDFDEKGLKSVRKLNFTITKLYCISNIWSQACENTHIDSQNCIHSICRYTFLALILNILPMSMKPSFNGSLF